MRRIDISVFVAILAFAYLASGCASLQPFSASLRAGRIPPDWRNLGRGWASYYGKEFVGRKTASGDLYDEPLLTAAHPSLPFGTILLVRRVATGRYTFVRINDRGPFVAGRVIDLSKAAASQIGLIAAGVGRVELFVVPPDHPLIQHL